MKRKNLLWCGLLLLPAMFLTSATKDKPQMDSRGRVVIPLQQSSDTLFITPLSASAVRVQHKSVTNRTLPEWVYVTERASESIKCKIKQKGSEVSVILPQLEVRFDKGGELLSFYDSYGNRLFAETARTLTPTTVQGERSYVAQMCFNTQPHEYLYGLGQFQDGYLNVKGLSRRLTQVNTQISIPFILSDHRYGVLWNNYGMTEWNPADRSVKLVRGSASGEQREVNVTSTEGNRREMRRDNAFEGTLQIEQSGDYALLLDVGQQMARSHNLSVDGETVIDMKNTWLPPTTSIILHLEKGGHTLRANLERNDNPTLYYKPVTDESVLRSPVAEAVDYTVFAGSAEEVISAYREVTGQAPLMPDWALGYIHCRERFHSSDEIMETAARFRDERIPLDVIVQDWQWWGKYGWNAMRFDEQYYPDPAALVSGLHRNDVKLMLSVWSKIEQNSEVGRDMASKGYYIKNTTWVDFFNENASRAYWNHYRDSLLIPFRIDAWWQDATEPENDDLVGRKVMDNTLPGEVVRNIYPLMVNKTIYDGLRKDDPERRPLILTRSGFPGMQRYGAAMWSGDVGNDWETLRRQIAGGLGLMASGLPWWTYDAGGFFRPGNQYDDEAFRERFLRWLQTSVFLPLTRVHGYMTNTEFWNYGEEVTRIARNTLDTRYRLFPYIYSYNERIHSGSTLMRPFVFDYPHDERALQQKYEYMFGTQLLVAPIVEPEVGEWPVYLPKSDAGWYDFYTGKWVSYGGEEIKAKVSKEYIPVYVKAGTILPLAQEGCQTVKEAALSDWEIRIYPGTSSQFTLYRDCGTDWSYEQGQGNYIPMEWDNAHKRLTIMPWSGAYNGLTDLRLRVVLMDPESGAGAAVQELVYSGTKTIITFP